MFLTKEHLVDILLSPSVCLYVKLQYMSLVFFEKFLISFDFQIIIFKRILGLYVCIRKGSIIFLI